MSETCKFCVGVGAVCGGDSCSQADPALRWEGQKSDDPCWVCWVRLGGKKRPCTCDNIRVGTPWDQYQCPYCWNYYHDEGYNRKWGGDGKVAPVNQQATPCIHLGAETGERVGCGTCQGNVEVKLRACRVHGKCSTYKKLTGVASCPGCRDFKAKTIIQIHVTTGGIGDHILGLTASAGLKRDHPDAEVIYACSSHDNIEWVKLFTGYDKVVGNAWRGVLTYRPHDAYSRNSKLQERTRWDHYAQVCGTTAVLPEVRPLPASTTNWAEASYKGMVALAPWSVYQERTWPLSHWLELEDLLLKAGHSCVILDDQVDRNKDLKSECVIGKSPAEVAAVLKACSCLVGNDSGIPHFAGMLRCKVLVLSSNIDGGPIYGIYPGVRVITTPRDGGPLGEIVPQKVADSVNVLVREDTLERAVASEGGRSLLTPDRLAVLARGVLETAALSGDMAELGVFRGGSARVISTSCPGKVLHLFDTFSGLPAGGVGEHSAGEFACAQKEVEDFLQGCKVEFHRGVFPENVGCGSYSFVHLDGDLYETTMAALEYFWPRLVPGGVLVLDDVGWENCPGVDRALKEKGLWDRVERTAPQQGVLRKK